MKSYQSVRIRTRVIPSPSSAPVNECRLAHLPASRAGSGGALLHYGIQAGVSQTTLAPETILTSWPAQTFPWTRAGERATFPFTAMMLPWMTTLQQSAPPPPPEVETSLPTSRIKVALPASVRISLCPDRLTLPPTLTTKVTLACPFVAKVMFPPPDVTSAVTQMTFSPSLFAGTAIGACNLSKL